MQRRTLFQYALAAASTLVLVGGRVLTGSAEPVHETAALAASTVGIAPVANAISSIATGRGGSDADAAVAALSSVVHGLSDPRALGDAFRSYYAFRAAHPEQVRKPYLYFVDYGLASTTPRGWVFDMTSLRVIDGPFMVAHGRGSSAGRYGVPSRFSNASGSAATSLGLYVAQELYAFSGHTAGQTYHSTGLRLQGVSTGFNDNARARGVVAHGAPYVTASGAGRSEGCPAVDEARAERMLPQLANGGMVFLYAPDASWLAGDPWLGSTAG